MKQNKLPLKQNYLQYKQMRNGRFARLQQAASDNAIYNELTEAEAMAVIEEVRQEAYKNQSKNTA